MARATETREWNLEFFLLAKKFQKNKAANLILTDFPNSFPSLFSRKNSKSNARTWYFLEFQAIRGHKP